jgi:hypothetical protein
MSRQISSRSTWWHKRAFPVFWFGLIGLFTVFWFVPVMRREVPAPTLLIPLVMAVFGYVLMRMLVFDLADEVWLEDDELIVRNRGEEERIAIDNIINVEGSQFQNPEHITLTLREPCRFGREIVFSPPRRWWPFGRHPLTRELMERVHRLGDARM